MRRRQDRRGISEHEAHQRGDDVPSMRPRTRSITASAAARRQSRCGARSCSTRSSGWDSMFRRIRAPRTSSTSCSSIAPRSKLRASRGPRRENASYDTNLILTTYSVRAMNRIATSGVPCRDASPRSGTSMMHADRRSRDTYSILAEQSQQEKAQQLQRAGEVGSAPAANSA